MPDSPTKPKPKASLVLLAMRDLNIGDSCSGCSYFCRITGSDRKLFLAAKGPRRSSCADAEADERFSPKALSRFIGPVIPADNPRFDDRVSRRIDMLDREANRQWLSLVARVIAVGSGLFAAKPPSSVKQQE